MENDFFDNIQGGDLKMDWLNHFFEETLAVWAYLFWKEYSEEEKNNKDSGEEENLLEDNEN